MIVEYSEDNPYIRSRVLFQLRKVLLKGESMIFDYSQHVTDNAREGHM